MICCIIGLYFFIKGIFICFLKRNSLIRGFDEDYASGKYDLSYAFRVGIIFMVNGTVFGIVGGLTLAFRDLTIASLGAVTASVISYCTYKVNALLSESEKE